MTSPEPVVRMIEQGWNLGQLDVVDDCVSEDYKRDIPGATLYGAAAFKERMRTTRLAMPDFRCTLGEAIVEGDKGASRWICEGTHRGELLGIPATGKNLRWSGIVWYELRDGLVVYEWELYDQAELLTQLDMLPKP